MIQDVLVNGSLLREKGEVRAKHKEARSLP
jgi:hypothetical protein